MYSAVVVTLKQPIFNIVIKRLLTSNVRGIQPSNLLEIVNCYKIRNMSALFWTPAGYRDPRSTQSDSHLHYGARVF